MFDINLAESTITILYIKMALVDFFVYLGAFFGAYKNYRANISIYAAQISSMDLTKAEKREALKIARYKYIRDNAKSHYMKVRKLVERSTTKVDDKLLVYVESFYAAMADAFGEPPTEAEIKQMVRKSTEIHEEVKIMELKNEVEQ